MAAKKPVVKMASKGGKKPQKAGPFMSKKK
jgi:hypothetical protein